jgi:hypothetical protein
MRIMVVGLSKTLNENNKTTYGGLLCMYQAYQEEGTE